MAIDLVELQKRFDELLNDPQAAKIFLEWVEQQDKLKEMVSDPNTFTIAPHYPDSLSEVIKTKEQAGRFMKDLNEIGEPSRLDLYSKLKQICDKYDDKDGTLYRGYVDEAKVLLQNCKSLQV